MKKVMSKFWAFMLALFTVISCINYYPAQKVCAVTSADLSISQNGIAFIKEREGFSEYCYYDGAQSSIGYGTKCGTSAHSSKQHKITREQAEIDMLSEINNQYIPNIRKQTSGIQMNQSQFDALVSFTYNTGGGTTMIKNSPLIKFLRGELSESDARSQFANYVVTNSATGKVDQGLKNRRNKEADLFFSDVSPEPVVAPVVTTNYKYYAPSSNITITWNSVSGANGYWIDIWKDGEHILSENLGNSTSYTLSNSSKGGYGVLVTALTSRDGACSEACSFYVQDVEAPQVSTERELYAQNSNVNITWTSSTGATSYWIDVWLKGEHIVTERVNDTKYILQNCSLGTYSVFVTALTETGGFSSARNEAYHFTVGEIEAPTVSTERKYYAPDSDVEINWTESKGNTSYWIDIWVKGEHIVTEQLKETTSYTLKNCKEGTYAVYVTAMMDTGGYSSARKEAYIFYVKEIEAPLVSTDKVYYNSEDDVIISWSASDGATSYWIDIWYRAQLDNSDENATHIVSEQLSADSTAYVLENCTNGKYAVYITAQESTGGYSSARNPATPFYVTINGDVNIDGKFNVADVVLLQKWLLAVPDTKLVNWKAADLCEDGRLDVFDLCLMKRMLVENS